MKKPEKNTTLASHFQSLRHLNHTANLLNGSAISKALESANKLGEAANLMEGLNKKLGGNMHEKLGFYNKLLSGSVYKLNQPIWWNNRHGLQHYLGTVQGIQKALGLSSRPGTILSNIQYVLGEYEHLKLYSDHAEEKDALSTEVLESDPRPINFDDTIRVQGLIKSIYDDNEQMFRIKPREFEEVIAEMLRKKGFIIELTQQTRDGGRDIIALHDINGLGFNRYLVECKRFRNDRPVDIGVVRELCYTVYKEYANKGIIFTTSYFTQDAFKEKELQKYMLDFKAGVDVIDWAKEYILGKK